MEYVEGNTLARGSRMARYRFRSSMRTAIGIADALTTRIDTAWCTEISSRET